MKQYLELIEQVLKDGTDRGDRTGTGTRSIFGTQTRYDLQKGFPLLTTKKVNFKAIVAELLWFLRGGTNINTLDSKIWNEWADADGNVGPIYGSQWRNWGAEDWSKTRAEAEEQLLEPGIDQISEVIHSIQTNPESRRHIVSAWNVTALDDMALPPCHLMFQFYVRQGEYLDCQMYQRSADLALGVPFNIASYALLMHMIAQECSMKPGNFTRLNPGVLVHTIGDAHIYQNHIEGIREQLTREPRQLPQVYLNGRPLDRMVAEDIRLVGYDPDPAIKFQISV